MPRAGSRSMGAHRHEQSHGRMSPPGEVEPWSPATSPQLKWLATRSTSISTTSSTIPCCAAWQTACGSSGPPSTGPSSGMATGDARRAYRNHRQRGDRYRQRQADRQGLPSQRRDAGSPRRPFAPSPGTRDQDRSNGRAQMPRHLYQTLELTSSRPVARRERRLAPCPVPTAAGMRSGASTSHHSFTDASDRSGRKIEA